MIYISEYYKRQLKELDIYDISMRLKVASTLGILSEGDTVNLIKKDLDMWRVLYPNKVNQFLNRKSKWQINKF